MRGKIEAFLSEEAIFLHKDYLNDLRLRYSVMEKSFPEIKNADLRRLLKMRHRYKNEIISLKAEIICHELFFDSFGDAYQGSSAVRECFRTEASFLYEVSEASNHGACYTVISHEKGKVSVIPITNATDVFKIRNPLLCIDLHEHSYFLDYGFNKDRYISNLLPYLKLGIIDKFLPYKD